MFVIQINQQCARETPESRVILWDEIDQIVGVLKNYGARNLENVSVLWKLKCRVAEYELLIANVCI